LRAIGIERVVAVDLTRPDMGIPVVRLVIPGLDGIARIATIIPVQERNVQVHNMQERNAPAVVPHECCHFCRPLIAALRGRRFRRDRMATAGSPRRRLPGSSVQPCDHPASSTGYFEIVPTVWHKEILWAMDRGIHVYGGASIGALRAAELADFGMTGIGQIYEQLPRRPADG